MDPGRPVDVQRRDDGIAVVTLARPERLNALDQELFDALPRVFGSLAADDSVRVVVLTGAGRGFCAGADLAAAEPKAGPEAGIAWMRKTHRGPLALYELPQPSIAAVNGPCAGGGLGLALSCDIRIAAPAATFRAPFIHMGLVPDFGCSRLLPRAVGEDVALELLLTGRLVEAGEAQRMGLVSRVEDDALGAALDLAAAIAATPGDAARATKALVRRAATTDHATTLLELEASEQGRRIGAPGFVDTARAWLARAHASS